VKLWKRVKCLVFLTHGVYVAAAYSDPRPRPVSAAAAPAIRSASRSAMFPLRSHAIAEKRRQVRASVVAAGRAVLARNARDISYYASPAAVFELSSPSLCHSVRVCVSVRLVL